MSEKELRTRRFYLILPLLALPFVTLAFWLMGGGVVASNTEAAKTGLNMSLPAASVDKDSVKDKLSFYAQANADSAKRREELRSDPNVQSQSVEKVLIEEGQTREYHAAGIRAIRQRIETPPSEAPLAPEKEIQSTPGQSAKTTLDPDLEAINQTIEKLAALQHPRKETTRVESPRNNSLRVEAGGMDDDSYFGRRLTNRYRAQFLGGESNDERPDATFSAVIPIEQVVQAGSVVRLQLRQPISISGRTIPAGTSIYGVASLLNERMAIYIGSIQSAGVVFPVSLSVLDLDGMEGIHVPASVSSEVLKSTADESLQSVNVLSLDPSFKTQALTAGIGAAKNLLSKKVKAIRVTIAAGYRVCLRDNKSI
jgi:hypothetical protein